jgi:hypothetical protein
MQFDDQGTIIVPVQYYFAPDGADVFPASNLFHSQNWEANTQPTLGPGELWSSPKTYSKGGNSVPYTGQGPPCASLDWWANGVPTGTPPLTLLPNGLPTCCSPTSALQGGVKVGGRLGQVLYGGLQTGGVITAPAVTCPPWFFINTLGRTAFTTSPTTTGVLNTSTSGLCTITLYLGGVAQTQIQPAYTGLCPHSTQAGYDVFVAANIQPGWPTVGDVWTFVSYDTATNTAEWSSPAAPPGCRLFVTIPPP